MRKFRIKHIPYKLVSFLLALIIWLTIKNGLAPTVKYSLTLPITFINADKIKSIDKSYNVIGSQQCTIDYIVLQENKGMISKSDFEAYVDLEDLSNTEHLNIHINSLNNTNNISKIIKIKPNTLHVTLDDAVTKEVEVKYVTSGNLDSNHSLGYISISPDKVFVSSSNKKMSNLSHIEVKIPIDNSKEYFKGIADAKLVSIDGKKLPIEDYSLSVSEINYSATVYSAGKVVLNQPLEGKVDPNYSLDKVEIIPMELPVQSNKITLQNIPVINLPTINIEGIKESMIVEVPVKDILPVGIRCDLYDKIIVTINVSKIEREIEPTAKEVENPEISIAVRSE